MLRKFNPEGVLPSPAYSQGVEATGIGKMVFVSGQVGVRADGSVPTGVGEQALVAIANMRTVLSDAGMDDSHIAKVTIYLVDESSFPEFVATAGPELPQPPPATTLVYVKALASPDLLVEIEAIAVR